MSKLRLTGKIVALFVCFATLLLVIVGVLSYKSGRDSLRAAAVSELVGVAIEKEAAIDTWRIERLADLSQLEKDAQLTAHAATLLNAVPGSPAEHAAREIVLQDLGSRMSGPGTDYLELSILDPESGRVTASTNRFTEGEIKVGQPYFDNGKSQLYLQGPYIPHDFAGKVITAGIPLRSAEGIVAAVLSARFDFQAMGAIVRGWTGLYRTEDAYLVNRNGLLLTHRRSMDEPAVLRQKVENKAVQLCTSGDSGVTSMLDGRAVKVIAVFRWLPKQQAGLIIEVDEGEALAPARSLALSVFIISVAALIAASVVAFLLARSITRPLRELNEVVTGFKQDDLAARYDEDGGNELESLKRAFSQMAQRVEKRTGELAQSNEQLHAAKQAVEDANRARNELLANLSHEARAPLESVIGMTDRLLQTSMTGDQRRFAETIQASNSGVRGVLNDIANVSDVDSPPSAFEMGDLDLEKVIEGTLDLVNATAAAKGLALHASVEDGTPIMFCGDERRLRQILINLLGNALKFTERGEVRLDVTCTAQTPESVSLCFRIVDTGPGLHLEAEQWLSRRLAKKTPLNPRTCGGTGRGLSVCQQLIADLGGELGVDNASGVGCTFWFTVTFARESTIDAPTRHGELVDSPPGC